MSRSRIALTALILAACRPAPPAAARDGAQPTPSRPVAAAAVAPRPSSATTDAPVRKAAAPLSQRTYTKPGVDELRQKLTPLQFEVTQRDATEPPFRNTFWDNHEAGIYVDVATGEPLFSSLDKFESGTGWPSFTRPIEDGHVDSKTDRTYGMERTEVRSRAGGSHLGHVFGDGPAPTGQRYCINSASLRFVPVDRLQAEGYGDYLPIFTGAPASPVPADTANACATPGPGERPGCETTLETALLGGGGGGAQARLQATPGVLEVEPGTADHAQALRVVFDPKKLAYRDLLEKWAAAGTGSRVAYWVSDEQRRVAEPWAASVKQGVVARGGDAGSFAPAAARR
jgi:peptide methionine sulfoxide reductase msrA/msrB